MSHEQGARGPRSWFMPRTHLVQHRFRQLRDHVVADRNAVQVHERALDVARAHPARVQRQDLVPEVTQARLSPLHQLQLERAFSRFFVDPSRVLDRSPSPRAPSRLPCAPSLLHAASAATIRQGAVTQFKLQTAGRLWADQLNYLRPHSLRHIPVPMSPALREWSCQLICRETCGAIARSHPACPDRTDQRPTAPNGTQVLGSKHTQDSANTGASCRVRRRIRPTRRAPKVLLPVCRNRNLVRQRPEHDHHPLKRWRGPRTGAKNLGKV